jgi:hypothetical protein
LRALRLCEKQILIFPGRVGGGRREKHYLSQRRKARKGESKATARMFAARSLDPAKFHGLSTPAQLGLGLCEKTKTASSEAASSGEDANTFLSRRRKGAKSKPGRLRSQVSISIPPQLWN